MLFFTFVSPTPLLLVRFGVYFYTFPIDTTTRLSWSMVNCSNIFSVIIAVIYRQAIKDVKPTCFAIILLPDILLNTMPGLVLFDEIVPTVLFPVDIIRVLVVAEYTTTAVDGDLDQPQDELDVRLFQGFRTQTTHSE
jgi:hypothetical protein